MRQHTTLIAWLVPFMAAASLALTHCSGNDSSPSLDGGKGGKNSDSSVAPGTDAAVIGPTGDDSGGTTDTGAGVQPGTGDAAPDAHFGPPPIPVPEGGAPSDPGSVHCGGAACAVSQGNTCCVQPADGGTKETCNPPNTPCAGGLKIECNEAADCNGGVCCQAINGVAVAGATTCLAGSSCPGNGVQTFQICRTDGECGSDAGGTPSRCIPQLCTNQNPPRTLKIEACAVAATRQNPGGTLAFCAGQ